MSYNENLNIITDDGESRNSVKNGVHRKSKNSQEIENKLRESEERFRLMFEQASVGMAFASLEGHLIQVNQRYCDITGYTKEELLKRTVFSITHPEDVIRQKEVFQYLLQNSMQPQPVEKRYICSDGSLSWVSASTSLIRDAQGTPLHYMAVITDINERKKIEAERDAVIQQEQVSRQQADQASRAAAMQVHQLETVFTSMVDGVFVYDRDGNILQTNNEVRELLGYDVYPEYANLPIEERLRLLEIRNEQGELLSEEMQPARRILRGETLKGVTAADATIRALNGHLVQINISGAPLRDPQGHITGGVMVVRDVTGRRNLERRTHESLAGLLKMAEALVQLPGAVDDELDEMRAIGRRLTALTCNILDCRRVGLFAIESETLILRPLSVVGLSPEQEAAWWQEQEQQANALNTATPEAIASLRSGEVLVLDMTQPPLDAMPNPYDIKVMLLAPMCIGDRLVGMLTLDYGATEHVYTQGEVALASAVATLSALVIERQRLLAEQADARGREVALQEANRRMEEFLGIASHELRTPLTTIKANVQLAKRRLKTVTNDTISEHTANKVEAASEMLSRAERQVGVLNRLVGDLIDISRIQTGKLQLHLRKEPSDLVQVLAETVQEQQKAFSQRTISLFLPTPGEPLPVIADADRIAQVLINYLTNALKYSESDKPVEVSLTHEKDRYGIESVRVAVRDEGPGLSPEEQKRIWECFYQSDRVKVVSGSGVGLGLGLYISQTIIERHHGHIGVDSTPGVGSTFWFTLPLVQQNYSADKEE
jgi:PAS domain S-box-containing protein